MRLIAAEPGEVGGTSTARLVEAVGVIVAELASRAALAVQGRRLVVLDDGEVGDDLVGDVVEALTSPCARLYGRRSERKALEVAEHG